MIQIITTRKITTQTAHVAIGTTDVTWAGAVLFERTACGLEIKADGMWRELSWSQVTATGWSQVIGTGPGFLFQPCQRCASKLRKLQATDQAAALEIDAQRDADRARERAAVDSLVSVQIIDGYGTPQMVRQPVDQAADDVPGVHAYDGEGGTECGTTRTHLVTDQAADVTCQACRAVIDVDVTSDQTADDVDQEPTSSDPRGWLLVWDYRDALDGAPARHAIVLVGGTDSERFYSPTTGEADQGNGSQGSADIYCGRVAYGVIYGQADGPGLTCPECSEAISASQGTHDQVVTAALDAQAAAFAQEMSDAEQGAAEERERQAHLGRVWVPERADQPRAWGTYVDVDRLSDSELLRAGAARVALANGDACWVTAAQAVAYRADPDGHARAGAMGDTVLQAAIFDAAHDAALAEDALRESCSGCAQRLVLIGGAICPACGLDVAADQARQRRIDAVTPLELATVDAIFSAYMACNRTERLEWEVSSRWVGELEPTAMGLLADAGRAAWTQLGFTADREAAQLWSEMVSSDLSASGVLRVHRQYLV